MKKKQSLFADTKQLVDQYKWKFVANFNKPLFILTNLFFLKSKQP